MIDFTISKAIESDAKIISELGQNAKELQVDDEVNQYYSEDDIKNLIGSGKHICLTAKQNDDLIGYILALVHDFFKEIYVSDIYVKEDFRGKGVGSALLNATFDQAQQHGDHWKWAIVQTENVNMQKFLEKHGLKKGKSFYFYYSD